MNASVVHTGDDWWLDKTQQPKYLIYSGPKSIVLLTIWVKYEANPPQGIGGIDVHADGGLIPDGSILLFSNTQYAGGSIGAAGSRTFLIPVVKRIELILNKGTVGAYRMLAGRYQITAWNQSR